VLAALLLASRVTTRALRDAETTHRPCRTQPCR
jgi:hypothetical protein